MTSQIHEPKLAMLDAELDEIQKHRIKFYERNGIPYEIINRRVVQRKKHNQVLQYSLSYDIQL